LQHLFQANSPSAKPTPPSNFIISLYKDLFQRALLQKMKLKLKYFILSSIDFMNFSTVSRAELQDQAKA